MDAARFSWRLSLLMGALAILSGGCGQLKPGWPRMLRVAKSTSDPGALNTQESARDRRVLKDVQSLVQEFDAGLRLHASSFSEANLKREIARQTRSGLGPDLIISNGNTSLALHRRQLSDAIDLEAINEANISPLALSRVTTTDGAVAGLPVSQYVQLACFDKRRLRQAPRTLAELAEASGKGHTFGFSMELEDLYWSLGGYQANQSLQSALEGDSLTSDEQGALNAWLSWLQGSSFQQNILFQKNQISLREQFIKGRLDWIPCWSSQLPELREALDDNLGITLLPNGPSGNATPITRLQVWSLGRNSSRIQRAESLKLLSFLLEPWAQKTLALRYRTGLPVNPRVIALVHEQLASERQLVNGNVTLGLDDEPSTQHANALLLAISNHPKGVMNVSAVLNGVIFGTLSPSEASEALQGALRRSNG